MHKSFIERIFPHSPGSVLPQYHDDVLATPRSAVSPTPARILLQDSNASSSLSSPRTTHTSSPLHRPRASPSPSVRYDDPFLPVERAAKALEQTVQSLLDAQSLGLNAGVGTAQLDAVSSAGSPTPTPSVATSPRVEGPSDTVPVRQPKKPQVTLRRARRGLAKSMAELVALKTWELTLIDREVGARDRALGQTSDLGNRTRLLREKIDKLARQGDPAELRGEAQRIEQEIRQLETTLLELKTRHRHLLNQVDEIDSARGSKLSSYTAALSLNETKVRSFLRQPPIARSLGHAPDPGMYALTPEQRTLSQAEEQWTAELDMLRLRKSDAVNERQALEEGSALWKHVMAHVRDFERHLRTQTETLAQSHHQVPPDDADPDDGSMQTVSTRLAALIKDLEDALAQAEAKNWNLLICAIGAELAAFEQARDFLFLQGPPDPTQGGLPRSSSNGTSSTHDVDLFAGAVDDGPRSPGETSNQSLEDTLREFGNGVPQEDGQKGRQSATGMASRVREAATGVGAKLKETTAGVAPSPGPIPASHVRDGGSMVDATTGSASGAGRKHRALTNESDDDDPGPDFLISQS